MEKVSFKDLKDKYNNRKESSSWAWSKCSFHHGSGRVTCIGNAQEWNNNVDLSNLFIGHKFSQGAYSKLHHGIYKEEQVAVKIVRVPDDEAKGVLASNLETQFIREVTFLSHLHHQNVIKFIGACKDTQVYCILTEYLNNGSLRAYLKKLEFKPICMKKVIGFALDIARGMEYIHAQGIIHRDLKPENVLVDGDLHLRIADFGASCEASKCDNSLSGTYRWMAPEMIKGKRYGRKVDVYSFGLILWEMVSGTMPFEDMTPIQVAAAAAVKNKDLRPLIPSTCPPVIRVLIQQCWALKPKKRPEFCKIVQVLEQFDQSLLAIDGTLTLMQKPCSLDHHHLKKGFLHWIQKIGHVH